MNEMQRFLYQKAYQIYFTNGSLISPDDLPDLLDLVSEKIKTLNDDKFKLFLTSCFNSLNLYGGFLVASGEQDIDIQNKFQTLCDFIQSQNPNMTSLMQKYEPTIVDIDSLLQDAIEYQNRSLDAIIQDMQKSRTLHHNCIWCGAPAVYVAIPCQHPCLCKDCYSKRFGDESNRAFECFYRNCSAGMSTMIKLEPMEHKFRNA